MNVDFVEYDADTGMILMSGNVPEDVLFAQGRNILVGSGASETHYVDVAAEVLVEKSPRPSRFHKYDYQIKEWIPDTEYAWAWVRADRNRLLVQSDWTQLPDVPDETKSAWAEYRQDLRDVTQQLDPLAIAWPEPPQ